MEEKKEYIGFEAGEICNRNGCKGIIEVHDVEGTCSCHINPPCSYCTHPKEYCAECDWSAEKEQYESEKSRVKQKPWNFKIKTIDDLDKSKIDWIVKTHTHFTMICDGVYPDGTTKEEVREKVKGTFGGKFTRFENGRFTFTAYTD
ncbi:hypothetical protein [Gracilimonas sediminicola]|uniref:Uncharacterized protein n=1 Tax=Gracilimonas sediminicola TaxID=2952158 RepID=A0A9X2L0E6_9BACT|nr:hypothetical protein [Gracilimonas sediminicola]MCP9290046.1 hypothetical protein [Gracilimonas sediminicola]